MQREIEAYREAVRTVMMMAELLAEHDVPGLLRAIDRASSIGPIVDPTLFRDKIDAMLQDKEMLEAALPLYRLGKKIERLRSERAAAAAAN